MAYVDKFCQMTDTYFDYWIGDRFGEIAEISGICFDFSVIKFCVDNDICFDWIWHWYYYNLDRSEKKQKLSINIETYCSLRNGADLTDECFSEFLDDFLK